MEILCQFMSNARKSYCILAGVCNLFIFSRPKFNIMLGNYHEMRIIQPLLLKDLLFDFNLCVWMG